VSALSRDYSATLSASWIFNRRMDPTWFIGAALGGCRIRPPREAQRL